MFVKLKPNEVVLKAGDSSHLTDVVTTPGKLILTNQRIYFKKNASAEDCFDIEVLPNEIQDVMYFKTGWFSNNGLSIVTKCGKELKFLLKTRENWGEMIAKMC
jgi:hypothetical protein